MKKKVLTGRKSSIRIMLNFMYDTAREYMSEGARFYV